MNFTGQIRQSKVRPEADLHAQNTERGAAVAGFALTSGLTTLVFLIVLQFAFVLYTKAVIVDAAGQGARVAARHDSSLGHGIARTAHILDPLAGAPTVRATRHTVDGNAAIQVTVSAQLPLLGPYGIPGLLTAQGNALVESYETLD